MLYSTASRPLPAFHLFKIKKWQIARFTVRINIRLKVIINNGVEMERTLILVKPDGVQRCLAGEIISRLERRGLKIAALKMLQMDRTLAEKHYAVHKEKPFFNDLVKFITSGPIIAAVLEGEKAIESTRQTMGSTDPKKAAPGTIRADLGINMEHNLIHGSDSPENAEKEIGIFFKPGEVLSYSRDVDRWLTGS